MALLVPFHSRELPRYLLGLLVIDPDDVVLASCTKSMS